MFISLFSYFGEKNISASVYVAATVYYTGCVILTANFISPSCSLRIIKEESGELSFDFSSATNSLNEPPRAVLLLHIRRVSMQTISKRTLTSVIYSYLRHAGLSVTREAAKMFSGG